METRFSVILPVLGLLLFTAVSIRSARMNEHDAAHPRKYYWWSSLRLDTDPLNRHPVPEQPDQPCKDRSENCKSTVRNQWVSPGLLDRVLGISGFPAFLTGTAVVAVCSKQGIDEVLTFMISMPILLFSWYFFVGWLLDLLLARRKRQRSAPLSLGRVG